VIRLALETATPWVGVALLDGERVLAEFHELRPMEQSTALAAAVRAVLHGAHAGLEQVEELAVSGGPGSFTGLRVGAAFARALADARGIPIAAVPTALALALGGLAGRAAASRGRAVLAAAGGVAFCQAFEVRGGAPRAAGELERLEYPELARRAAGAPGEAWVCDPGAAERLAAGGPPAPWVWVEPRAAWVGAYAERAGEAAPAREFMPRYGHSPVFRKRARAS